MPAPTNATSNKRNSPTDSPAHGTAAASPENLELEQFQSKKLRPSKPTVKLLPIRYEHADPKDLVVLISSMLLELIRFNDKIPLHQGRLTRFHSRSPPRISVHDYLQRITTHATLSPPILLSMVYYIDRLCAMYPAFTVSSLTIHRFLIASATVASKGLSDSFWTNKTYARVGGISMTELALLELEFLFRVEWRIVPQPEVLNDYYQSLAERCDEYEIQVLDAAYPRDPNRPMNHLRRFVRMNNLPKSVQDIVSQDNPTPQTIFLILAPPLPAAEELQQLLAPYAPRLENAEAQSSGSDSAGAAQIKLHTIRVPTLPPLGTAQATKWSKELWPVIYNPAAARSFVSPPVQVLNRTREFIQPDAGRYLALARRVAEEAEQSGRGRGVGAVVVDPDIVSRILDAGNDIDAKWADVIVAAAGDEKWADAIVAVAGDARYSRSEAGQPSVAELHTGSGPNPAAETYNADLEGGPDLHALMRAAEIVAYKRRAGDPKAEEDKPNLSRLEAYFLSQTDLTAPEPPSELESQDTTPVPEKYQKTGPNESLPVPVPATQTPESHCPSARIRPRSQGGYLCTDLDVYLTHEPCVCCCMGLLLSRFRSVTFPRRGRIATGGLASQPVVSPVSVEKFGYGETSTDFQTGNAQEEEDGSKNDRLYYGLHWRKELNWRALGFEFVEDPEWSVPDTIKLLDNRVVFYA
ncbi:cyclin-domain-containing protein [Aspergillus oleicola]